MGGLNAVHVFSTPSGQTRDSKSRPKADKCNCAFLRRKYPTLVMPGQKHALCRTPAKSESMLPPDILPVVLQNTRNVTLPTIEFVKQTTACLHDQFDNFSETDDAANVFPASFTRQSVLQDKKVYMVYLDRGNGSDRGSYHGSWIEPQENPPY